MKTLLCVSTSVLVLLAATWPLTENNQGHQSLLRWHCVDNVPFQKSFEGCIEKYFNNQGTLYACTARWYLAPDGVDPYQSVPVTERDGYYAVPK
jgi:hypothetical protein